MKKNKNHYISVDINLEKFKSSLNYSDIIVISYQDKKSTFFSTGEHEWLNGDGFFMRRNSEDSAIVYFNLSLSNTLKDNSIYRIYQKKLRKNKLKRLLK